MAIVYGPASPAQIQAATVRKHRHHHWWSMGGILAFAVVALNVLGQATQTSACRSNCPPPPPPQSPSVSYGTTYASSAYGFSLAYDAGYAGSPTTKSSTTIGWQFPLKAGGYLDAKVFGAAAKDLTPAESVASDRASEFGDFSPVYAIPDAEVGYVPGSGEVFQGEWSPLMGSSVTERLAIIAAKKKHVTVTLVCEAPKASDKGGHPDPSNLSIGADQFCDQVANTVTWPK